MNFMKNPLASVFLTLAALTCAQPASAGNLLSEISAGIAERWNKSMDGDSELYVPLRTWHNRATYSRAAIDRYNEAPWGLGFGKSYHDSEGNWQGFYAMAFKDSHNDWEPIAGYGSTWDWYTPGRDWHVGLGYTVFLTSRSDTFHRIPFPGVLPLVSAGYKRFTLQGVYIPGLKEGTGNVAFFWAKYAF
jgi:palmitoyl transferase